MLLDFEVESNIEVQLALFFHIHSDSNILVFVHMIMLTILHRWYAKIIFTKKIQKIFKKSESSSKWTIERGESGQSFKWTIARKWTIYSIPTGLEPNFKIFLAKLDGHGSKWTVIWLKMDGPSGKNWTIWRSRRVKVDGLKMSKWTVHNSSIMKVV